ncbi:hypothetical protein B0H19DRAFT_1231255 [Mycena capillaripes]|nr:hypothetical protein B0H19DRAFT_1231255 [Mycena capillaripes]
MVSLNFLFLVIASAAVAFTRAAVIASGSSLPTARDTCNPLWDMCYVAGYYGPVPCCPGLVCSPGDWGQCLLPSTANPETTTGEIDVDFALPEAWMEVNPGVLAEPAVFPGLPSLKPLSPLLPWAITVHASGGFVVLGDVLQAIWRELNIRITGNERANDKKRSPTETRNSDVSVRSLKWKRALTRLELLGGTKFGGLSDSTVECEVWVVNFLLSYFLDDCEARAGHVRPCC